MATESETLQAQIASLQQRVSRPNLGLNRTQVQAIVDAALPASGGFDPKDMVPVLLASDAGPTTTENAWVSVHAGAPEGAKRAAIRVSVNSTDNADDGDLRLMGSDMIDSEILVECVAGVDDARDSLLKWVNLDTAGNLQYKFTNTSGTSIEWSVKALQYSMG